MVTKATISPAQLITSLQGILPQVNSQTHPETSLDDGFRTKLRYRDWILTAEATRQAAEHSTPELAQIERLVLALRYRTHQIEDVAAPAIELLKDLFSNISRVIFPQGIPKEFADEQIRYLCSKYPAFASKLLEPYQQELGINFFRFCLLAPSLSLPQHKRVSHWVDIFIQYPEIAERLMKSDLYEKLGVFPENIFIHATKGVLLKIESNWVPIHLTKNNLTIRLGVKNKASPTSQGLTLTLEEIFQQFESNLFPDVDVSIDGVTGLNSSLLGSRNSKGVIDLVDPMKWTEYKSSVELTLPEFMSLYPEAKDDFPFGFVLRANLLSTADSQAFFDFVMRLENGNYRVISLKGPSKLGAALYQQKKIFYPLTQEQGKEIMRRVAEDITKYRKSLAEIDMQPYLNEVFGSSFYTYLQKLVTNLNPLNSHQTKAEVDEELAQVIKNLDPDAFDKFMQQVVTKLVDRRDVPEISQLINTTLETLSFMLQKEGDKIPLPSQAEVRQAFSKLSPDHLDQINQSLLALTRICFEVLHPFRLTVAEAERKTPVQRLFLIVEAIPWKWLKDLLHNFLLLMLGPFRDYHYRTTEGLRKKSLARMVQAICNLKPENHVNRPSQLFISHSDERLKKVYERIQAQLTILTGTKL